ncbi:MAG: polymer-forming cytoskeletal protein [Bacteroidetes bacterium]|nr:polymer-forming cytoskeletal protein [Bacteroidota bacterium]MBU1717438.1 polymer-forming cytoskeletal protein [Bacteroidota bacterium]
MAKYTEQVPQGINQIITGTTIKGDVNANGDMRIDGFLVGSITSKGKIVVGTSGQIEGEITCQNADISGEIKAKINVTELLTLKATAKFTGDIRTNKLAIEPGAIFTGSCVMGDTSKGFNSGSKFEEKPKEEQVVVK